MAGIAEVGAKDGKKPEKEHSKVTIYFGVFFDGTNNHRLQVAKGKKYRGEGDQLSDVFSTDIVENTDSEAELISQYKVSIFDDNMKNWHYYKAAVDVDKEYYMNSPDENIYKSLLYNVKKLEELEQKINDRLVEFRLNNSKMHHKHFWSSQLQDIHQNDYTNIAILEPCYKGINGDDNAIVFRLYICGSGTSNNVSEGDDSIGLGFGQGKTGVIQKVIDVCNRVTSKLMFFPVEIIEKINFDIFGFSRGATSARIFTSLLSNESSDLNNFIIKKSGGATLQNYLKKAEVRFLGIYDTVSSVGVLEKSSIVNIIGDSVEYWSNKAAKLSKTHERVWSRNHQGNVSDLGLNNIYKAGKVVHICAKDEYRENFALVSATGNNVTQILVPGCHADVGGGYNSSISYTINLVSERTVFIPNRITREKDTYYFVIENQNLYDYFHEQWKNTNRDKLRQSDKLVSIGGLLFREKTITFTYTRASGYNYVTLQMMVDYANELMFEDTIKTKYPYTKCVSKTIYEKIKKGEKIDSNIEKKLRQQYLHFSSNYETIPVNVPNVKVPTGSQYALYERIKYE